MILFQMVYEDPQNEAINHIIPFRPMQARQPGEINEQRFSQNRSCYGPPGFSD